MIIHDNCPDLAPGTSVLSYTHSGSSMGITFSGYEHVNESEGYAVYLKEDCGVNPGAITVRHGAD